MNNKQTAKEGFLNGYNCAQAIISTYGPALGLPKDKALKLATGLGAGLNYKGRTCGAVIGAYIILSLRYGVDNASDTEGKALVRKYIDKFITEFENLYGSTECKNILGADVGNEEELKRLRDEDIFRKHCSIVVEKAAEILDRMI
jgi:C_GCAxxG_C_C family probable redox protein